jgi:23S rRNA pseudouridine1911/1915/1917 synthase
MTFIGYPIVGDQLYGHRKQGLNISRQALHSHILGFVHPSSKKYMEFSAPLPQDMQGLIDYLEGDEK